MTRRDFLRAEELGAAIASWLWMEAPKPHGVDDRGGFLGGDQVRGWRAGWSKRRDPPDTVDGWAGWLAAHIFVGMV